ncbi:shikimate dehydrogenase family protein [Gemmatimonas groenlandica]|uniref:Shikimate dehydrogenase (NADP(+)) n=1 Tax=Gemmatimonas groenlandica TaxID=2732249 RepID=A0A6M4IK64_9BACT|nr:shikimate dehydrogenase [Gemmatimonas groenlandica]QJR35030.1 shikimate dehydrogenase [Gemmatimonas groenlandica]
MTEHRQERVVRAAERPSRLVILGHPVAHSLSPVFQNAALLETAIPLVYDREDVAPDGLADALRRLAAEGAGGNITIPHKEAATALVARCTPVALRTGAVNTFWTEQGDLIGHNTDVDGAAATIRALLPVDSSAAGDTSVVLLGAGGSAAATLVALHSLGYHRLTIVARTTARAHALSERLSIPAEIVPPDAIERVVRRAGLVINATPIGLRDDALPMPVAFLPARCAVFDLVYRRGLTPWIAAVREAGHRAEDGLRMLVEQGASAFETWFDVPAPRETMWGALDAAPPTHGSP